MPCILKTRIVGARDLPVMDKATELTDAYVEVKFADYEVQRTQICRRTLNPQWNEDFRFEVSDDADLQNEPLEIKVLDYDAISANDVVGSVYIDLNPLLSWDADLVPAANPDAAAAANPHNMDTGGTGASASAEMLATSQGSSMTDLSSRSGAAQVVSNVPTGATSPTTTERQISGWFPLYDTLRGIRGEVNVQVRLLFFGDVNPFKDSSAGVLVFGSTALPSGYKVEDVFGFVEVLINEDDPEYHWSDSFRTPRYSNESRQKVGGDRPIMIENNGFLNSYCTACLGIYGADWVKRFWKWVVMLCLGSSSLLIWRTRSTVLLPEQLELASSWSWLIQRPWHS